MSMCRFQDYNLLAGCPPIACPYNPFDLSMQHSRLDWSNSIGFYGTGYYRQPFNIARFGYQILSWQPVGAILNGRVGRPGSSCPRRLSPCRPFRTSNRHTQRGQETKTQVKHSIERRPTMHITKGGHDCRTRQAVHPSGPFNIAPTDRCVNL